MEYQHADSDTLRYYREPTSIESDAGAGTHASYTIRGDVVYSTSGLNALKLATNPWPPTQLDKLEQDIRSLNEEIALLKELIVLYSMGAKND